MMLKEKFETLGKKLNREEINLIVKNDDILDVLQKLIELQLNKINYIDVVTEDDGRVRWVIELVTSELIYETLVNELSKYEIYTAEEDRFGKYFEKRLGA